MLDVSPALPAERGLQTGASVVPEPTKDRPAEDRNALAIAFEWSSTIISISIAMVVPGLIGYYADTRLGTGFLFLTVGMVLGVTLGIRQLIRLAQPKQGPRPSQRDKPRDR